MSKDKFSLPSPAQAAGHLYNLGTLVQLIGAGVRASFCYIGAMICFAAGNILLGFLSKDKAGEDKQSVINTAYALYAAGTVFLRMDGIQTNLGTALYLGGMGSAVVLSKLDERLKDASPVVRKIIESRNIIAGAGQAVSRVPLLISSVEKINSTNPSEQKFGVVMLTFSGLWLAADVCLMFIKTRPKAEQVKLARNSNNDSQHTI